MPSDGATVIPFDRSRRRLRDKPLETGANPPDPPDMVAERVAVLEEIAKGTKEAIGDLRAELRSMRTEFQAETRAIRQQQWTMLWALIGIMLAGFGTLLGAIAKGFQWIGPLTPG